MRVERIIAFLCFIVFAALTITDEYPKDYFRSPVQHDIKLSGTFGELRPNHFHSGIDIKSAKGGEGDAIVAVADGYITRISESGSGYGKALYIAHPNGYTTVYAHLRTYAPHINEYVKSEQYTRKSFALNLLLEPEQFPVKKGEKIAEMGNTGSSGGPHLHFEIRDTKTEEPINPLFFGFKVNDTQSPKMHQVRVYQLNEDRETQLANSYDLVAAGGGYTLKNKTIEVPAQKVGIALKTYDYMDGVTNWNGVYSIAMYKNDSLVYQFRASRFSFDQTRYMNAHVDYEEVMTRKSYLNRCYTLPGNQLTSLYDKVVNNGVVELAPDETARITLVSKDIKGNETKAQFFLRQKGTLVEKQKTYNYFLPYNDESIIDNGLLYLYFPKGCFYENLYLNYHIADEASDNIFSAIHQISNYKTPVQQYFDVALQPINLPNPLKNKAFVAYCSTSGSITNVGATWKNDRLWGKSRTLGNYCIMLDTVPPSVKIVDFQQDMRRKSQMVFSISDNFRTDGDAKALSFSATVDGEWILMEYDAKTARLFHRFDGNIAAGQHQLRLEVVDAMGNKRILERSFIR